MTRTLSASFSCPPTYDSGLIPIGGFDSEDPDGAYAAWFKLTASSDCIVTLDTFGTTQAESTDDPDGDICDTRLTIYTGPDIDTLIEVASNDDTNDESKFDTIYQYLSEAKLVVESGTDYYVKITTYDDSGSNVDSYVLHATVGPTLTSFTPPAPVSIPDPATYRSTGPVQSLTVSPSGGYIAGVMRGAHDTGGGANHFEVNGLWIGKVDSLEVTTLLQHEYYDSSTFPSGVTSTPETVEYLYDVEPPQFVSETLVLQTISASQYVSGPTIPNKLNIVLAEISGGTATLGDPFQVDDFDDTDVASAVAFRLGSAGVQTCKLMPDGRVYGIMAKFGSGYVTPYYLVSFAVSGTEASDFSSVSLGTHYQCNVIAWYEDGTVLLEMNDTDGFTPSNYSLSRVKLSDGSIEDELTDMPTPFFISRVVGDLSQSPNRKAWVYKDSGGSGPISVAVLDVETMTLGDYVDVGDVVDGDDYWLYDAFTTDGSKAAIHIENDDGDVDKAIWFNNIDPALPLSFSSLVDIPHFDYFNGPEIAPDYGVFMGRFDSDYPYGYYFVTPEDYVPPPPPPNPEYPIYPESIEPSFDPDKVYLITDLDTGQVTWGAGPTSGGGGGSSDAADVVYTPTGGVAATDVQAAITELDTEKAALASPTFTGDPKAPTPSTADNDTSVATTAFVKAQGYATLASPTLTGDPKAPTPSTADNDTSIATTAYVQANLALYAKLASPALTGTPTAPTATPGTNTTQVATTAFVAAGLAALVASSPAALDTLNELAAALGNDPNFATTIATSLGLKAPLASPVFTGNPTAPTPSTADNDTSIATTAYVQAQGYALLASPVFTGDPKAPTPTSGDNDTSIATTAFVQGEIADNQKVVLLGVGVDPATAGLVTGQIVYRKLV